MAYIRTGRFDYRIETNDPSLQWQALRDVYADMMAFAEKVRSEPKCPDHIKLSMDEIISGSDLHIVAIAEAIEPLSDERKVVLYHLVRHRLIDVYSTAYSVGDIRLARAVNRRTQIMRAKRHPNTASIAAAISAAAHAIGEEVPKRVECMVVEIERASGLKVSKRTIERALKSMRHLTDDVMSSGR